MGEAAEVGWGAWPLVGRDRELAVVARALASGRSLVIVGEPGAGKTRLVRDGLASTATPETVIEVSPTEVLAAMSRISRASPSPVLRVVVDDFDVVDPTARTTLTDLARSGAIRLVAITTGGAGASDLVPLWKEGLADRVDVPPLSRASFDELVQSVLDAPVERGTLDALWRTANGNVLVLREVLIDAMEGGTLRKDAGVWFASESLVVGRSRLRELVESRIGRLTPDEQQVVDLLAVGHSVGLRLLEELVDFEAVARLEERGLLRVEHESRGRRVTVRLSQPTYGEVRRTSLAVTRRHDLLRRLGAAVEGRRARRTGDAYRLAAWGLETGSGDPALFLRAAYEVSTVAHELQVAALDRSSSGSMTVDTGGARVGDLALRFCLAALDTGGGAFAARYALRAATMANDRSTAARVRRQLEALSTDEAGLAAAVYEIAYSQLILDVDGHGALATIDAASARISDDAQLRRLRFARARVLADWSAGQDARDELEAIRFDAAQDARRRAAATGLLALVEGIVGRCEEANEAAQEALDALQALGPLPGDVDASTVAVFRVHALRLAGRLGEAQIALDQTMLTHYPVITVSQRGQLRFIAGEIALVTGEVMAAERSFREAAACFRLEDTAGLTSLAAAGLVLARTQLGDVDGATQMAEAMHAEPPRFPLVAAVVEVATAWFEATSGRHRSARDGLVQSIARHLEAGRLTIVIRQAHELARLGFPEDAVEPLAFAQRAGCDAAWLDAMRAFAEGSRAGDGTRLDAVSEQFAAVGAVLWAAEASLLAAPCHREAGLLARAKASRARADVLLGSCPGVTTFIVASADAPPALTRREHEVAMLAGAGLSDRDIAARLFISVRTVQTHLANAYGKLGARRRTELPGLLRASSLAERARNTQSTT